jgi:Glycosyl transferases group 1
VSATRRLIRAASRRRELGWRRPPPLTVAPASGHRMVYCLAPDLDSPSGGVRNIYRHVDSLNALGIDATVLHGRRGFRCGWFAHQTTVTSAPETTVHADDILVVPECFAPGLARLPSELRKVVFNQGAYHTFDYIPLATTEPGAPYAGVPNLVALLTVSEDSAALLSHTFQTLPVHTARVVVDPTVFHPGDAPPGRRIAYVASRRPGEREQLLHMLRARGVLDGWELVEIHGHTETQTAELMRGSALFLSFSDREGFGLPPAEAMASGCYVVGFTGQGGDEFFDPEYCTPVPDSDILAFATAVEELIGVYEQDRELVVKAGRLASERVLARYSAAGLRDDLQAAYGSILAGYA